MKSKAVLIRDHRFTKSDAILIDANVWLYLYGPHRSGDRRTLEYSQALKWILKAGSSLYVDVLILSEFVNRFARMEFELWKSTLGNADFKAYRNHPDFREVAAAIAAAIRRILRQARPVESGFTSIHMDVFLHDYVEKQPDFNDRVLLELCRNSRLTLVTHDADFKDCGIPVITANPRLLQ